MQKNIEPTSENKVSKVVSLDFGRRNAPNPPMVEEVSQKIAHIVGIGNVTEAKSPIQVLKEHSLEVAPEVREISNMLLPIFSLRAKTFTTPKDQLLNAKNTNQEYSNSLENLSLVLEKRGLDEALLDIRNNTFPGKFPRNFRLALMDAYTQIIQEWYLNKENLNTLDLERAEIMRKEVGNICGLVINQLLSTHERFAKSQREMKNWEKETGFYKSFIKDAINKWVPKEHEDKLLSIFDAFVKGYIETGWKTLEWKIITETSKSA